MAWRKHKLAFALFALAFVPYGTAVPLHENGHTYDWTLQDWPHGGEQVRVQGQTVYRAQVYGLPGGTLAFGANTSSTLFHAPGGAKSLPMTPELEAEARKQHPAAFGPEGWHLHFANIVPPQPVLLVALFAFTCIWWARVRAWTWSATAPRAENLRAVALLSVWPCVFLATTGLALRDARVVKELAPLWIDPELAIFGTALVASLGLVFALTYRPGASDIPT